MTTPTPPTEKCDSGNCCREKDHAGFHWGENDARNTTEKCCEKCEECSYFLHPNGGCANPNCKSHTTDKGWEKEFDLRLRNRFFFATEINADSVKDFIRREREEEYMRGKAEGMLDGLEVGRAEGQQNPEVGFLRQYLNESPDWKGKMWTDEEILRFIRIPHASLKDPQG